MFWSDACRVFEGIGAHDQAQRMTGGDHSAAHTALVRHCVIALRKLGCLAAKNLSARVMLFSGQETTAGLGTGSSDIVGILPGGRAICCECKTGRGELSAEQARFLRAVNAVGGLGFVARCVEDVRRAVAGATLTVDAPDRRESCAACGAPYEPHVKQVVRELGGAERSWHMGCHQLGCHQLGRGK